MVLLSSIKQHFKIQNIRLLKNVDEYILSIEDLRENRSNRPLDKSSNKSSHNNSQFKKSKIHLNKESLYTIKESIVSKVDSYEQSQFDGLNLNLVEQSDQNSSKDLNQSEYEFTPRNLVDE